MRIVGMDEAGSDEPVILISRTYCGRIKDKVAHDLFTTERADGNNGCDDYDDDRDREQGKFWIKIS